MSKNKHIIICRGVSGSGKSTWSKHFVHTHQTYARVSRDDLRFMLVDGYMQRDDKSVFLARQAIITTLLFNGFNLVIDDTYLAPIRIKQLNDVFKRYVELTEEHLDIEIKDFIEVPLKTCLAQNKGRGKNREVPEEFIHEYYNKYVLPLLKRRGKTKWTM